MPPRLPGDAFGLLDLSSLGRDDARKIVDYYTSITRSDITDKTSLLRSIPYTPSPSTVPLSLLSALLNTTPGPWPVFELLCCHARLWKFLPEDVKSGRSHQQLTRLVDTQLKRSYRNINDLLFPALDAPAIKDPQTRRSLSHRTLARFVLDFRLPLSSVSSTKPTVAIALPNGPLLALTLVATVTYYTAAPVTPSSGVEQFIADVLQSRATVLLALRADVERFDLEGAWVKEAGIEVLFVDPKDDMTFSLSPMQPSTTSVYERCKANSAEDVALVLFTSGTSGSKKVVPLTIHSIVSGVAFVVESWGLTDQDTCLNMMPLFHVGGTIRNLFAPVMSGGATVCCTAFDPNLFWDVVEDMQPTWYYASPSMHSMILEESANRAEALRSSRIRLVCNAAGGLLPSLACQIRDTFHCIVLPSYGMTECMPISTPPLDYRLERTGTSGVSVGPEIAILDSSKRRLSPHQVGNINVRGAPVFPGYLKGDLIDKSAFSEDGWFETGDMGYLDNDGYLYITGRSKEVINRGGELISPFEVEEAIMNAAHQEDSPVFGRISQALAFSMPHDVLQEVVGIVLVTPDGTPYTDLRQLQEAVKSSLNQVKVPVLIVFMDGLPKNNNKVLRIRLAERLGLSAISDDVPLAERHYVARCPPSETPLSESISSWRLLIDYAPIRDAVATTSAGQVDAFVRKDASDGFPELFLAPPHVSSPLPNEEFTSRLRTYMSTVLDDYLYPSKIHCLESPFATDLDGAIDEIQLEKALNTPDDEILPSMLTPTEQRVAGIFAQILSCPLKDISVDSDFFQLGGDSLRAGRLLSVLRREFQVRLPIDLLFTHGQINSLAKRIDQMTFSDDIGTTASKPNLPLPGCSTTRSSTQPLLLLIQLLPLVLAYPMKRALTWTVFMYFLTFTQSWGTTSTVFGRLMALIVSLGVGKAVTQVVAPIAVIITKWVIIGRYREGIYPMWGLYHTRWWLVQKAISVSGLGAFAHFNASRILYYRLLGAQIGEGVTLDKGVTLGEYDLLHIGDGVTLDRCIVRPFAAERNTSMYLGRIYLGARSSVGLSSIVAAGTCLPEGTCIGPNSSSWEVEDTSEADRHLSQAKAPEAHPVLEFLVGLPILLCVRVLAAGPWMAGLVGLVIIKPGDHPDRVQAVMSWFAKPERIGYHYLALILHAYFGPMVLFFVVVAIKRLLDAFIGKTPSGPVNVKCETCKHCDAGRSQLQLFRKSLLGKLMNNKQFHEFTELFGSHYEFTSMAFRAMGAKIGKRVYWPGTGPSVQDFDLLDIGDDVVFGSRAHLITSDGKGTDVVRVGNGSMVADRVVLLPGVALGDNVVMGSGALTRRNKKYDASTVWVGSKHGEAICLSTTNTAPRHDGLIEEKSRVIRREPSSLTKSTEIDNPFSRSGMSSPTGGTFCSTSPTMVNNTPRMSIDQAYHKRFDSPKYISTHEKELRHATAGTEGLFRISTREVNPSMSTLNVHSPAFASSRLEKDTIQEEPKVASTPFGRAFYEGEAPYHVLGLFPIFLYSGLTTIFVAFYWNVGTTSSLQLVSLALETWPNVLGQFWWRPILIYALFTCCISILMTAQALFAIAVVIAAKWILMGRRRQGNYNWDESSYCQRWQLFLTIERIRRHCYGGHGILGMFTGTYYCTAYFRWLGAEIGRDCALFAGGLPSLMFTEPDLLTLGDRVSVDDASLVSHINSRGHFTLNPLAVGDRSVLRSGARLLSGAQMGSDSCLLEHTLVMAGDVVDNGVTNQGWPAEDFSRSRVPTIHVQPGEA